MSMIVYNIIVMSTKYTAIVIILYVIIVTISHWSSKINCHGQPFSHSGVQYLIPAESALSMLLHAVLHATRSTKSI